MKKILILAALLTSTMLSAADFGWGTNSTLQINKGGASTSLHVNSDTSLFLSFDSGKTDTRFGFYKYDTTTNSVTEMLGTSGEFSAGDTVGIWLESDGKTLFSSHELNQNGITYDGWQLNDSKDLLIFGYELSGKPYLGFDNLDIKLNVTTKAPTGQPLPGVFVSLSLVSVVFSALLYKKRRKAAIA